MAVSYKKLWKLLIDKDIKKKDLAAIAKMGKGGHVTTEVLVKICSALDCQIEDIMEIAEINSNVLSKLPFKTVVSRGYVNDGTQQLHEITLDISE